MSKLIANLNALELRVLNDSYDMVARRIEDLDIPVIDNGDHVIVDLEGEHGFTLADYYGEFRGGLPWINPALEEMIERHHAGVVIEWNNPGSLYIAK